MLVISQTGDAGGVLAVAVETLERCEKELDAKLKAVLKDHPGYALFLGIPVIGPMCATLLVMEVLSKMGRNDLAYKLLLNKDFPS